MAIRSIEAIPIAIREPTERELAYGKIAIRRNVIVRIADDSGPVGTAETAPIPIRWGCEETQESVVTAVNGYIAPLLLGEDPTRINFLLDRITARVGDLPYARSAVCDALYDLSARLAGVPVTHLLGGRQVDRLAASWSISFKSAEEMAAEAAGAVNKGYRWIKVKIGSKDPEQDVRNVAAVRDAVGRDIAIHVDANAGYRYLDAADVLPRIETFRPRLIEQPVAGWDLDGMRTLRRKLRTPIMADESVRSYRDMKEVIRREAADAVLMKLAKHGGIRESQKIADLAGSAGITLYPGIHFTSSIGVATSVQFYASVPDMTPGDFHQGVALFEHDLVDAPLLAREGAVDIPSGPGIGVELNSELLTRARRAGALRDAA
jgi:L-alanine-DL-glutamate epimerase-like enolase superfamily enzyme